MKYPDEKIDTLGELVRCLGSRADPKAPFWFRGQGRASWNLSPSLARKKKIAAAEAALIKRFKQNAVPHLSGRPSTEWEWMFLMQHHRLPTRLLDWTESPLAALFFAIEESKHKGHDAALWCLDPVALNQHANISFPHSAEIPAFDHDEIMRSYLPSQIAKETTSELSPVAAIAVRNSPRMAAQLGTFTITHRTHTALEDVGNGEHVWRMIIPHTHKSEMLGQLSLLRVSRLTLFPELDSVAADALEIAP